MLFRFVWDGVCNPLATWYNQIFYMLSHCSFINRLPTFGHLITGSWSRNSNWTFGWQDRSVARSGANLISFTFSCLFKMPNRDLCLQCFSFIFVQLLTATNLGNSKDQKLNQAVGCLVPDFAYSLEKILLNWRSPVSQVVFLTGWHLPTNRQEASTQDVVPEHESETYSSCHHYCYCYHHLAVHLQRFCVPQFIIIN